MEQQVRGFAQKSLFRGDDHVGVPAEYGDTETVLTQYAARVVGVDLFVDVLMLRQDVHPCRRLRRGFAQRVDEVA